MDKGIEPIKEPGLIRKQGEKGLQSTCFCPLSLTHTFVMMEGESTEKKADNGGKWSDVLLSTDTPHLCPISAEPSKMSPDITHLYW